MIQSINSLGGGGGGGKSSLRGWYSKQSDTVIYLMNAYWGIGGCILGAACGEEEIDWDDWDGHLWY